MTIHVRRAVENDIKEIAFNVEAMALESSQEKLDPSTVLQGVTSLFKKPELGFYIVAEENGQNLGSLVIVYEWSDWRHGVHWWIHSVYVRIEARNKSVYRHMYEFVKNEVALSPEARDLKLSVDNDNKAARAVYERLGMKDAKLTTYYSK